MRNHLIALDGIYIRGLVRPLGTRLTDFLRSIGDGVIGVDDAEVVGFEAPQIENHAHVAIRAESALWAHEFVALSGDDHQRRHYRPEEDDPVRIWPASPAGLIIDGQVARSALQRPAAWLVVKAPRASGATPPSAGHAATMSTLPWIAVNMHRIAMMAAPR